MDLLGDTLVVAVVCDVIEVGSSSVVLDIYIYFNIGMVCCVVFAAYLSILVVMCVCSAHLVKLMIFLKFAAVFSICMFLLSCSGSISLGQHIKSP